MAASSEIYPGRDCTIFQLLHAAKKKLYDTAFCGSIITNMTKAEVKALERDTLEVLALVRSLKNSFSPINRIPPVVLSLIPDYFHEDDMDEGLLTLTHVCRCWREIFISRSSLWTKLNFTDLDKTRTYIQRSKSSPLEFYLKDTKDIPFPDDVFPLATPHLHKLKSLTILTNIESEAFKHFHYNAPLLEELNIELVDPHELSFDYELFNGDLSSLRKLSLGGIITSLPWKNLANLQVFALGSSTPGYDVNQLLDFFESAPLLHTIKLRTSIPSSSNAPPERVVPLNHLKTLYISADPPHAALLNHLSLPIGASLIQAFTYSGKKFPIPDYLPRRFANLKNLSDITALNIRFDPNQKFLSLAGQSGGLRMLANWGGPVAVPYSMDRRVLRSLGPFPLSKIQRLSLSKYKHPSPAEADKCPVLHILSSTKNLRTLVLSECNNRPFILALTPSTRPSTPSICPNLEEFVLYIRSLDQFHTNHLINMAKIRVSKRAKLSSVAIVGLGELAPAKDVLKLREYVSHVEYRIDDELPAWDSLPGEPDSGGYEWED